MSTFFIRIKPHLLGMLAVFLLITLSVAAVLIWLQPLEYEASSSILVRQGKHLSAADMKAELDILRGEEMAKQVLAIVGAEQLYPQPESKDRIKLLQAHFTAKAAQGAARIIEISFRHPNAELAAATVGAAITLLAKKLEQINEPQSVLLQEELDLRRKQMQQAQNVLAMFRQNDRLQGSNAWQTQYLGIRRGRLEAVLEEETQLEDMLARELAVLRQHFAALSAAGDAASREAFLTMKLYQQELLRKYKADDPLLAATEAQLAQLRKQLQGAEAEEQLADQIAQVSVSHAKQQEKREAAQRELHQLVATQQRQEEQKNIFSGLEAEVEKSRELYAQQFSKVEERKKVGMNEGYVTTIEPPQPPITPSRPDTLRSIALAACLGLLASLIWPCLRRLQD